MLKVKGATITSCLETPGIHLGGFWKAAHVALTAVEPLEGEAWRLLFIVLSQTSGSFEANSLPTLCLSPWTCSTSSSAVLYSLSILLDEDNPCKHASFYRLSLTHSRFCLCNSPLWIPGLISVSLSFSQPMNMLLYLPSLKKPLLTPFPPSVMTLVPFFLSHKIIWKNILSLISLLLFYFQPTSKRILPPPVHQNCSGS